MFAGSRGSMVESERNCVSETRWIGGLGAMGPHSSALGRCNLSSAFR